MSVEIRVPQMGESVTEAVVGQWFKKVGDRVGPGMALVNLETDKVAQEIPADDEGVLESIVAVEGATVNVGDLLATVATSGAAEAAPSAASPERAALPTPSTNGAAGPLVTPVADRMAAREEIDPRQINGSGTRGRVTKDDVVQAVSLRSATSGPTVQPTPPPVLPTPTPAPSDASATPVFTAFAGGEAAREERVRISRRRQTIATRLVEAQHTAAMLTTFNEIDMGAVMEVRKRRRDAFKDRHGVSLGFMSFFTKAAVGALKAFPRLNAEIQGNEFVLKKYYDIGIAVGAEEGLVVPVLREADRKSFAAIESAIADMAARARNGKLTLDELRGGTFTITNGGVFGSLLSTPILNAPEVGILGLHKIEERPMAVKGEIVVRPMMYVALSYDHRIVDGREAVQFLVRIKELIEDPETLLLEG